MLHTEVDSLTIKDFESRYGVTRSNIYNRINGLRDKGYLMEPEKQRGKSVFDADQIAVMDALDAHLKNNGAIADFPAECGQPDLSYRPIGQLEPSYRTQDTLPVHSLPAFEIATLIEAIAARVAELITHQSAPDPLANLRAIQEACDRGWELRTSQLAPLLGLKSLPGQEIRRYGFTFKKVGRIGAESAWRVSKN